MTLDRRSSVPDFTIGRTVFECWVTDGGHRYEWRSQGGHCKVGRGEPLAIEVPDEDGELITRHVPQYWAEANGQSAGDHHKTLGFAMLAAVQAARRQMRRAA